MQQHGHHSTTWPNYLHSGLGVLGDRNVLLYYGFDSRRWGQGRWLGLFRLEPGGWDVGYRLRYMCTHAGNQKVGAVKKLYIREMFPVRPSWAFDYRNTCITLILNSRYQTPWFGAHMNSVSKMEIQYLWCFHDFTIPTSHVILNTPYLWIGVMG